MEHKGNNGEMQRHMRISVIGNSR